MTFEEFDYVYVDYDSNTFTIIKEGHSYTYDIHQEAALYSQIMGMEGITKYEACSGEYNDF